MIRMRMINTDDLPGTLLKFAFGTHKIERVHVVPVGRTLPVVVPALPGCVDRVVFIYAGCADHHTAAFVRIRFLRMIVDLAQHGSRYFDHSSFATFTTP